MINPAEADFSSGSPRKHQLLESDSLLFAVPQDRVTTIVSWSQPNPLPFAPKSVMGIVCIDGRMFTVINTAPLLNSSENEGTAEKRLLVALTGEEQLALAVGRADAVIDVAASEIKPAESTASSLIRGILEHDGQRVLVLDLDQLFPNAIQGRERRRRRT
jgi:chemotaxis signal transduction protein